MLIIYTQPNCKFCNIAKKYLSDLGFEFKEINIKEDKEARAFIKSQGHRLVPQIYWDTELFVEGGAEGLTKLSKEEIQSRIDLRGDIQNTGNIFV